MNKLPLQKRWITLMAASFLVFTGCGSPAKPQPQPINEAIDTCETCHMTVKENGYAAQIAMADGSAKKFDDIGCEAEYEKTHPEQLTGAAIYVQDRNTKAWIEKSQAVYVYLTDEPTPMGYGLHAFTSKEDAEAFVKQHGKGEVLDAAGLAKYTTEGSDK